MKLRILIADDHPLVAEGIRSALEKNSDWQVAGIAKTVAECESLLIEQKPDILVLDIGMPADADSQDTTLTGANTLESVPQWKRDMPEMRILVLTLYGDPSVVRHALDQGVDGFVLKMSPAECLLRGVQAVADGEQYLCPETKKIFEHGKDVPPVLLTHRETEVLRYIVAGLSEKMVADRVNLSYDTVHSYMKFLRMKLGVNNTAALVRKALEQRLV